MKKASMKFTSVLLWVCLSGWVSGIRAQELIIYFPHNSADFDRTDGAQKLKPLAEALRDREGTWILEGRASSRGSNAYNDSLSLRRAQAVRDYLAALPLPRHTLQIKATGETLARPVDTDTDRAVWVRFVSAPLLTDQPLPKEPARETAVRVTVIDAVTRQPLEGHTGSSLFSAAGITVQVPVKGSVSVTFSAEGYQDSTVNLLSDPARQTVELLPEGVLQKLVFRNIYFYANTADIVPESFRVLEQMLKELQAHPGVHIQVRGHVNWPEPNPVTPQIHQELQELSDKRAKAVMNWLIKKGIPAEHLSAVGLGYSQMVFPQAVTEGQQAQNRRVEILLMR